MIVVNQARANPDSRDASISVLISTGGRKQRIIIKPFGKVRFGKLEQSGRISIQSVERRNSLLFGKGGHKLITEHGVTTSWASRAPRGIQP